MFFIFLVIGAIINAKPKTSPSTNPPSNTSSSYITSNKIVNETTLQSGLTLQQIIAQDQQSVVYITDLIVLPNGTRIQFVGSGVIYGAYNNSVYIVTNRHVVDCVFADACPFGSNQTVSLETFNGNVYVPNFINYSSNYLDLARMRFYDNKSDYEAANIDYNYSPVKGTQILVIGQPLTVFEAVSQGIISDISGDQTLTGFNYTVYTTDAEINHGNSGGGTFLSNNTLQLIGIPSAIITSSEPGGSGVGVITPINNKTFASNPFYYCANRTYSLYDNTCYTCPTGDLLEPNNTNVPICLNQQNITNVIVPYLSLGYENSVTGFSYQTSTSLSGFTVNKNSIYDLFLTNPNNEASNVEIDKFQSETPGFTVIGTVPQTPFLLPTNKTTNYTIKIRVPNYPYYGPVSIEEFYHNT
jgi:S1-C subfamily serine protease